MSVPNVSLGSSITNTLLRTLAQDATAPCAKDLVPAVKRIEATQQKQSATMAPAVRRRDEDVFEAQKPSARTPVNQPNPTNQVQSAEKAKPVGPAEQVQRPNEAAAARRATEPVLPDYRATMAQKVNGFMEKLRQMNKAMAEKIQSTTATAEAAAVAKAQPATAPRGTPPPKEAGAVKWSMDEAHVQQRLPKRLARIQQAG